MIKQSAAVLALFLGTSVAKRPANSNFFATGMNGDEDMGEDITMKGDKFHYVQAAEKKCSEGEANDGFGYCVYAGTDIVAGQEGEPKEQKASLI